MKKNEEVEVVAAPSFESRLMESASVKWVLWRGVERQTKRIYGIAVSCGVPLSNGANGACGANGARGSRGKERAE